MKKFGVLFVFVVLSSISFADVDFQIVDASIVVTDGGKQLGVTVQNSGSTDFEGETIICSYGGRNWFWLSCTGVNLPSGSQNTFFGEFTDDMFYSGNGILLEVDYGNKVKERFEDNNKFNFVLNKSLYYFSDKRGIVYGYFRDTVYLLPGESSEFSFFNITQRNDQGGIIGVKCEVKQNVKEEILDVESDFLDKFQEPENSDLLEFGLFQMNEREDSYTWYSNSSSFVTHSLPVGEIYVSANEEAPLGCVGKITVDAQIANTKLENHFISIAKNVVIFDRKRGDIDGNGDVDEDDLAIMEEMINGYSSVSPLAIYEKGGIRRKAGSVLFKNGPDVLSNTLMHMYLFDQNDPLPLSVGIGKPISKRSDYITEVPNKISVSGKSFMITAPGAQYYNLTAVKSDGELFQKTGKISEFVEIEIPDPSLEYKVETIRIKNSEVATSLGKIFGERNYLATVYSNDKEVKISLKGKISVSIYDLTGKIIHSSFGEDEMIVPCSSWRRGVYLLKINEQTHKIMK